MPDGAAGVVQAQPDPAQFVHGPAVRGVQRQRALLVHPGRLQVARGQAHLARQEVHVRLVRGQAAGLPGRGGGDVQAPGPQRRLRHADMGLPVSRGQPPGLHARPQRLGVVVGVQQRVAGQPVRPFVRRIQAHRAVGRVHGLLVPPRAELSPGQQAPGPGVLRLRRDQPGQHPARLVVAFHIEHRVGARQLLPELGHAVSALISAGVFSGSRRGRRRRHPRWRTGRHSARCRTTPPVTA